MNTNKTFAAIVFVALILNACSPQAAPTDNFIPVTSPIGTISAPETLVEFGPVDQLIAVTKAKDFYNDSTVRVTNGGVAKLDLLDHQISINIFNDTAVGDVKADPAGTPDLALRMKLVFGGLSGEVTKHGIPAQFEITNGVKIYILGTQFLVLYDPGSGTTYIGNFDGTVAYTTPGQQAVQFVQAGQLYEIPPSFETIKLPLTFTRAEIENLTISKRSTLLDTLKGYLEPTATPTLTATLTASPTSSPTPSPTITLTPTKVIPCDKAAFVADLTIPDGTSFSPGFQFTKVWRLRNVGTCTWTSSYSFVFYRGEQMGGPAAVNIPSAVAPGQTLDIPVNLVAPQLPGSYRGEWMLRDSSGALFGAGANGTTPIWVKVNVMGLPDLTVMITNGPISSCNPKIIVACFYLTTVEFVITNTGPMGVTSSFQVLIETTGLQSRTITVNGLPAGSTQNFSQEFSGSCFNPDCTARVTVDSSNTIPEANETNNVAENTVTGIRTGTIAGIAFSDNNGDRVLDQNEAVSSGLTVTLYDSTGNTPLKNTTTDANGKYTFANLNAGAYRVKWVVDTSCGLIQEDQPVNVTAGNTTPQDLNTFIIC
jgi:hypothetical protein